MGDACACTSRAGGTSSIRISSAPDMPLTALDLRGLLKDTVTDFVHEPMWKRSSGCTCSGLPSTRTPIRAECDEVAPPYKGAGQRRNAVDGADGLEEGVEHIPCGGGLAGRS